MPGLRTVNLNCCSKRRRSWNPGLRAWEDAKAEGYALTGPSGAIWVTSRRFALVALSSYSEGTPTRGGAVR